MSANLATGQNNTHKRVRIHPTANEHTTEKNSSPKMKSPKALALACVKGTAASLHPQVQKIVENYGIQFIDLYHKLQQKITQLSKMTNNPEFIPRSARINFEFYVRPEIKQTPEFSNIESSTTDLIKSFQLNLKEQIMATMRLDIQQLHNEIETTICHLLFYTAKAFHLQHNPTLINHTVVHTVAFLITGFGDNLLKHCRLNRASFNTKFTEVFNDNTISTLCSLPAASLNNVSNTNNPLNRYARNLTQPSQSQEDSSRIAIDITPAANFIDYLRQTLETILVTSIDNYTNQVNTNTATSQLEALRTELLHEQETAKTAEQMDFSPSVSPQEQQELIAKSTSQAVSGLSREIQSLKAKLENSNSNHHRSKSTSSTNFKKNSPTRGRTRASLKKKSSVQNTLRSRSPASKPKQTRSRSFTPTRKKHADKNNGSSNNRRNEPNKRSHSKSNKRQTNLRRSSK